jgi:hypothetical protein
MSEPDALRKTTPGQEPGHACERLRNFTVRFGALDYRTSGLSGQQRWEHLGEGVAEHPDGTVFTVNVCPFVDALQSVCLKITRL